jgi:hypothetical protein
LPTSFPAPSCGRSFFPEGHFNQVPATAVQDQLRQAFRKWGLPRRFRVDNGTPWGSKGDLPTDLAFWLFGLGIDMIWNPPCRPQKNGVIERMQGVGKNWAEPGTCRSAAELQTRLDEMDAIHRESYPSIGGKSRKEAYPNLKHSGCKYTTAWERTHWSLERVTKELAGYALPRTVDHSGCVSLYDYKYYVGETYRGWNIQVLFDPQTHEWIFATPDGQQLRTRQAKEITRERIVSLTMSHRRDRSRKKNKPR